MKPLPRLKRYATRRGPGTITVVADAGVELTLDDPDGRVLAFLDLLDGTRTAAAVAEALAARWPDVRRADVDAGIAALDEAYLLEDAAATTRLDPDELERYFSNLAFFGTFATLERSRFSHQERLRDSHVLLLGVGGLGSTVLYNLAGLGIGRVTLLDFDRVALKNFARQFLYSEEDIGSSKVERAAARARAFNSTVEVTALERRIAGSVDVRALLDGVDLVVAAVDQPADVRFWVNEACVPAGVPFVSGGMNVVRGSFYSVDPVTSGCLECWRAQTGNAPLADQGEQVNRAIGPAATMIGSLVALEALRYLTRFAPPVAAGKFWVADFATGRLELAYEWPRVDGCRVCDRRAIEAA